MKNNFWKLLSSLPWALIHSFKAARLPHVSGVPDVSPNPLYKNCFLTVNPWEGWEVSPAVLRSAWAVQRSECLKPEQLFKTRREFPSQPLPLLLFQVLKLLSSPAYISSTSPPSGLFGRPHLSPPYLHPSIFSSSYDCFLSLLLRFKCLAASCLV